MKEAYQPHIDILRAIAVFLVVFNHLDFHWLPGGFIGVDVFFVISGYLITYHIIKERSTSGHFSFKNFYKRRVIRLAPAFFTVIITSTVLFVSIMTTDEILNYLKTIIASVTLSSNIYFSTLLSDYFSISAKSTPLLHFWSLSLEEQFYLFWPLFLILIYKFTNYLRVILIITLIFISLFFAQNLSKSDPITAYYLLPTRAFEFAIGALLVFLPTQVISRKLSITLGSFSLIGLVLSSYYINNNTLFPSVITLIPCSLAAVFIFTAHAIQHNHLNFINYLGKISYPIYLWHWPLIVYLSLLSVHLTLAIKLSLIIITIALATLTHELIEKRIKNYPFFLKQPILALFVLPSSITILCILLYLQQKTEETGSKQTSNIESTNLIKCVDQSQHPRSDCFLGDTTKKNIDIFLIGDSHANSQSGFIDYLAKDAKKQGYEMTFSSTSFLPHINRTIQNPETKQLELIENFQIINKSVLDVIQIQKPKFVAMGGYFPHNWIRNIYSTNQNPTLTSKQSFILGLQNAINEIEKIGATAIIINDNPILLDIDTNCNLRSKTKECSFAKEKYIRDFSEWSKILIKLKTQHPNLVIIDFNDIICRNEKCYSSINNIPLYRDSQHLTYKGSEQIAIEYLKIHENPFK